MSQLQSRDRQPTSQIGRSADRSAGGLSSGLGLRLLISLAIVAISAMSYFSTSQVNPITGKNERISMTVNDEVRLGLQHAGQMGRPSRDFQAQQRVSAIGARLVQALENTHKVIPYPFEFTLLADREMVNAFALPGGQIFITEGLYHRLENDGEIAGVLAHEMGHVIERHSAKQMHKSGLIKGIAGATGMLGGDATSAQAAAQIGNLVTMRYSREAEFEADGWAVKLNAASGYHPAHMISVLEILNRLSGGAAPPEFLSTHPSSESRIQNIRQVMAALPDFANDFRGYR
jgi:predicted Zn-dependent protease